MISSKEVRSPAGQKLIHDLMLEVDELEAGVVYDDVGDADEPSPVVSKQRIQPHGSGALRPTRGSQRRGSGPAPSRAVASAKSPGGGSSDHQPRLSSAAAISPNRPATAPASSYTLLPPPLLPAARGQKDGRASAVSPTLERHLVSRHASAYLGAVTAVLHQVASPAATGAHRDTQRRPGTVPRDVYLHSALRPPKRQVTRTMTGVSNTADGGAPPGSPGVMRAFGATDPNADVGPDGAFMYGPGSPGGGSGSSEAVRGGSSISSSGPRSGIGPRFGGPADALLPASPAAGGGVDGSFSPLHHHQRGDGDVGHLVVTFGANGSGDSYVPYLDRSYASHAPLACTVDALARRAEAHKALTRQRLMQKQQELHLSAGGGRGHPAHKGGDQTQQQHLVLFHTSTTEPYELRLEGGIPPVALGLAWDTSPGVIAAAASAAAAAAAAATARAEGLTVLLTPRDSPGSPLRYGGDFPQSPASRASARSRESPGGARGSSPNSGRRRRGAPTWVAVPQGHSASGRVSPAGAPGSPARKVRIARTPQSAAEAAEMAADADAVAREHLPPAVRRGYGGQLAAQTVKDWETIAEPNRRMMQQIENATNLVRRSPGRTTSRAGLERASSRQLPAALRGQSSMAGASAAEPSASSSVSQSANTPFGLNTSARSRRRYIRYSLDVFPELGLAARSGGAGGAEGGASGGGGWSGQPERAEDDEGTLDSEPSVALGAEYPAGEVYWEGERGGYGGAQPYAAASRGPRYMLAAAARVPVPVHLHPLPTPSAAVAAVVASGSAAGAAVAALPQWIDPLTAAAGGFGTPAVEDYLSGPLASSSGSAALPAVGSSSGSLHGGASRSSPATAGLGARGVGLHGHPTGPAASEFSGEQSQGGSWSVPGSAGPGTGGRNSRNEYSHPHHPGQPLRHDELQREHSFGDGVGASGVVAAAASGAGVDAGWRDYSDALAGREGSAGRLTEGHRRSPVMGLTAEVAVAGSPPPYPPSLEPSLMLLAGGQNGSAGSSAALAGEARMPGGASPGVRQQAEGGPGSRGSSAGYGRGPGSAPGAHSAGGGGDDGEDSSVPSRLSTAASSLPAAPEDWAAAGGPQGGQGVQEDAEGRSGEGLTFRDAGFAAATGSAHASASGEAAGGGADGDTEDGREGSTTPRLPSRLGPRGATSGRNTPSSQPQLAQQHSGGRDRPHRRSSAGAVVASFSCRDDAAAAAAPAAAAEHSEASKAEYDRGSVRRGSGTSETARGGSFRRESGAFETARGGSFRSGSRASETAATEDVPDSAHDDQAAAGFSFEEVDEQAAGAGGEQRTAPSVVVPQGPVLTHGTGYRVVTSVAAARVSEDPREAARLAQQRDLEAQLERSADHQGKLKAASRATKALARAGPQHQMPSSLPPLTQPAASGYGLMHHRASRVGGPEEAPTAGGGSLSVVAAPVPAPEQMDAMATAAWALLTAPHPAQTNRTSPHQPPPGRRETSSQVAGPPAGQRRSSQQNPQDLHSGPSTPSRGRGSYMHVQAATNTGRTAQMQDVWAS